MLRNCLKRDVQCGEDDDLAEVDEEEGNSEEEQRVTEVRDAARGAMIFGGVGVVLQVDRLEDERFGVDGFGCGCVAHKRQEVGSRK